MWLGGGNGVGRIFVRFMSRERAPNLRKINPKVSQQDAVSIAEGLYNVIKRNGPLSISNTWNHAKEAGVDGLNSKTHMKIMLKWMRGRKMLKLICNHVGSSKKFLHYTLPDESQTGQSNNPMHMNLQTKKESVKTKRKVKS